MSLLIPINKNQNVYKYLLLFVLLMQILSSQVSLNERELGFISQQPCHSEPN